MAVGNADEFEAAARELRTVDKAIASIYVARTGQPLEKIRELLAAETWMSAQEALALGFVDEIAAVDAPAGARPESRALRELRAEIARQAESIAADRKRVAAAAKAARVQPGEPRPVQLAS